MARLVLELRHDIASYDTIIGDDASGRLPTLFLREIANNKRAKEGKENSKTFFLVGGRYTDEQIFQASTDFISSMKPMLGRVLLATEHIASGYGMKRMAKIFQQEGISFDIASVSVERPDVFPGKHILNPCVMGRMISRECCFIRKKDPE
jgi:hypothetical protein